jgi:glycosyltransferase involved in cell wall biosynthesis
VSRLCMVVHAHYPLAEPRVEREAKAARDAGYEVHVVCLRNRGELRREVIDGITIHRLPLRHVRGASKWRLALEYLSFALVAMAVVSRLHRRRRIDLVQVHAPPDFLAVAGLPIKLRGGRLILDVHDISTHMYRARFTNGDDAGARKDRLLGVLTLIERGACTLADSVVTVHEPYRRELISHGVPEPKVQVVMNAVDEILVEPARRARTAGNRPAHPFTLAYHGTITEWYGVDLIVDALRRLEGEIPAVRAIILGEGDALPRVRELADRLGVADRVRFSSSYVPIGEALREVARADCGIIPNRASTLNTFALSSKLFEYVALGVPVVSAELPTIRAHFSQDELLYFRAGDTDSLVAALLRVARDPASAKRRAQAAQRRYEEYRWPRQAERYVALLRGG